MDNPPGLDPAYAAVYELIDQWGDTMPPDPAHRNAMIWRAVSAALETERATTAPLRRRLAAAVFTAEHWRSHAVTWPHPSRTAAHPLNMVLAALSGETDPNQLGIDPRSHTDLILALHAVDVAQGRENAD
ncbi:hypothetical protein [Streptomonospora litoralis]|uniref:Uncharacterized protein n=1 Tax=Streptomonospora litoralis TaxID=2498135 RepID=A0A4V0ZJH0_9ACTN|nr:hypothetical protein [Streptomonospora litoralis]QBI53452.1 hypothetical protein EKD16_08290 [Streptomonospora litoralis]